MLMNIQCASEPQITIRLTFDDETTKVVTVGKGDLVHVEYNKNGVRRRIEGKVVKVSDAGTEPRGWAILIDGSDDFDSQTARITPTSILDIDIIRKDKDVEAIESPKGRGFIAGLKVIHGRLFYTKNGVEWSPVVIDRDNIMFEDKEEDIPHHKPHRKHHKCHCQDDLDDSEDGDVDPSGDDEEGEYEDPEDTESYDDENDGNEEGYTPHGHHCLCDDDQIRDEEY